MEFIPAAAMLALVVKFIDFLRYASARDVNGVVTQLVVWAGGVAGVILVAQTAWADGIEVSNRALSQLDIWSLVFVGLQIASGASLVKDALKSVDNHNSSAIPTLLTPGPKDGIEAAPTGQMPGDVG